MLISATVAGSGDGRDAGHLGKQLWLPCCCLALMLHWQSVSATTPECMDGIHHAHPLPVLVAVPMHVDRHSARTNEPWGRDQRCMIHGQIKQRPWKGAHT